MDSLALSAEEYDAVQAAVTAVAPTWAGGQRVTLNALFDRWKDMTDEVEEGYSWCAPELSNDIWCRGVLAKIWPMLPARVQEIRWCPAEWCNSDLRIAPGHGAAIAQLSE